MPQAPSKEDLRQIAESYHFELSEIECEAFLENITKSLVSFQKLSALAEPKLPTGGPRVNGYQPSIVDDPLHAWAWKTSIKEAGEGRLAGRRIAIKDNIAVAGVPMKNGSSLLDGYVPDIDATVVTRILAAGGEITGKSVCEDLCFSGGSHTSHPAPVLNPRNRAYMAGGSSSGSAALVASGQCDMAIGGDQGGSIRIPSSWCGIFGLKPTWGLVPYTGAFPIEPSLDHVGPMAGNVTDVALLLDVIAGRDGLDPRQVDTPFALQSYSDRLNGDAGGLRVGILREGFGWADASSREVDDMVASAAAKFAELGAAVSEISVPMHREGLDIWNGIAVEGAWSTMVRDNSMGHGGQGYYDSKLIDFYWKARKRQAAEFSPTVKVVVLLGDYLDRKHGGSFYARAQNLRRALREAYDAAFREVDVLIMPTTPQLPTRHDFSASLEKYLDVALNMMNNTATFDATGHPAMSVPCGSVNGLPVGMMLVGRRFDEATVLRAAYHFEQYGLTKL